MSTPSSCQVVIVEDHLLLAETLGAALRLHGIATTVLAPGDSDVLLPALLATRPELVLLDLDLGGFGDSIALIAPLVDADIRVLIVTGSTERLSIAAALEQGAVGHVPKSAGFDALVTAAAAALSSDGPLDPSGRAELLAELGLARDERAQAAVTYRHLTDREQGTLQALGRGHSVHEIATRWVVSEATVRTHVRGVLLKLGVSSQLAAVAQAHRFGWLG